MMSSLPFLSNGLASWSGFSDLLFHTAKRGVDIQPSVLKQRGRVSWSGFSDLLFPHREAGR